MLLDRREEKVKVAIRKAHQTVSNARPANRASMTVSMRQSTSTRHEWTVVSAVALVWALFAAGVYLPDVGRGFIKDDFRWVLDGTDALHQPLRIFWSGWNGNFYRPLVALSFGIDHALYGLSARGYGMTNFVLYVACAGAVFVVLRELGFRPIGAAAGSFAWAINPSGLDMAVLWISGRTSLLMTLFSCAAVVAMLRRHRALGGVLLAAALFSKEDALAVPLLIAVVKWIEGRSAREWQWDLAAMGTVVLAYFALRTGTQAIGASSAPDFYRLTWDPRLILVNTAQYLDRAGTSTLALFVILAVFSRRVPSLQAIDRKWPAIALAWFVAGLCITVRVPVRSSLYVVFASIASAIVFAAFVEAMRTSPGHRSDRALLAALSVVLLLIPAYGVRNDRWVEPARVSSRTFSALLGTPALAHAHRVVFRDEPIPFSNLSAAVGGVEQSALQMYTGRPIEGQVVPPGAPDDGPADLLVRLERGAVVVEATPAMR
jgi:hypothetical protein